jgi:hypothetical protein
MMKSKILDALFASAILVGASFSIEEVAAAELAGGSPPWRYSIDDDNKRS